MSDIILFHFESNEIRYVGDGVNHEWIAKDVCGVLGIQNYRDALSGFSDNQKGVATTDTLGGDQEMLTVTEAGLYRLIFKSRKKIAERFQNWVTDEVLPSIRKTGSYSLENLERQFLPKATVKEIKEAAKAYKEFFGAAYAESYFQQQIKRHQPHLLGPEVAATDRSSLKSAEALLTPTQLASELKLYYSSGKPSPRKVNNLLESLGYQAKIEGIWSATEKGKTFSDRKPVQTNSKSDKDQLLWYASILDVLREHVIS